MGKLKSGETYVYERVGDQIFARAVGSGERTHVGGPATTWGFTDSERWRKIVVAAETNDSLRDALERAIMIYELGFGDNGKTIDKQ